MAKRRVVVARCKESGGMKIPSSLRMGFRVTGPEGPIWCETRRCADYIADLLRHAAFNDDETFRKINNALQAESDPMTWFPPTGTGNVIGS